MKSLFSIVKRFGPKLAALALVAVTTSFMTSCSTTPPVAKGPPVFKFTILRYPEPVPVSNWVYDPAQSACPEGAALNLVHCMQHGNVTRWLASWDPAERPNLTKTEKDALLAKWQLLENGQVKMLGRVVAGGDLIIELSVVSAQHGTQKVQLPLKHADTQWVLTAMEPDSEYLNWEKSSNTILTSADPLAFRTYLSNVRVAEAKVSAK